MPGWKERKDKKLREGCEPKMTLHFDLRRHPETAGGDLFEFCKILCGWKGCRTIVTEASARSDFSKIMFHDRPADLEPVVVGNPKKKRAKGKGDEKPQTNYQCWILE
eukprot:TRINITY_DN25874_c0_g2_i1.p2 TRINITY_DN25874_c0_g2~~TRINITY_DN25874_c0_g2_i1.p2  ORF type:complete len:107 (+),score=11.16 TRINITY_DN25874_c0_g2_i1:271-591(+)